MLSLRGTSRILVLIVFLFVFGLSVEAQEDCLHGFKIYVHDQAGKAVKGAKLEAAGVTEKDVLPADVKPVVSYSGAYVIADDAGRTIKGDFLLKASAEGFEPDERRINFPVCELQRFELRLQPKGSKAEASFDRLFNLHGTVFDEAQKPFGGANVEATYANGRVFQATSNAYGFYEMDVPEGAASVRVTNSRIPEISFDKFTVEDGSTVLNVPVCLKCKRAESKN
jgi:Carboxypeptidase regulatory-like domain